MMKMLKSLQIALLSFIALTISTTSVAQRCVDKSTYYAIDRHIERIASEITDEDELVHFFGGIVRQAAHDFMDYDRNSDIPYGSDGCIEWDHDVNKGLWGSIWCDSCPLTKVYYRNFQHTVSKADFWIIAANAVIRQLSVEQSLDLFDSFLWGRKDSDSCVGSGGRIPTGKGCKEIEDTFLDAMGLTWKDAVALMGAHTIGAGHEEFSGHEGYWMPSTAESLVFDKQYYEEIISRVWRSRNLGTEEEDFVTGTEETHEEPQMMLKSDMCFWYDTDEVYPCCSRTNRFSNGENECDWEVVLSDKACVRYSSSNPRIEAVRSVVDYIGGPLPNKNQYPFYKAFATAWFKATTNGHENLQAVRSVCW